MLKHLYIRNYALFAETHVEFPAGLNILTGETGAGKSLLIGALGLINGKRADNSVVFRTDDKCIVEARFGRLSPIIREKLKGNEEFDLEDDEILIRREIRSNGKSRAFINDTPVSLQTLRDVSAILVDLHSQHESYSLLSADRQLEIVDAYAGCESLTATFAAKLRESQTLSREIRELEAKEQQAKQQLDYYQFQAKELQSAGIQADEEEKLEQELNLLQHAEEVREALGGSVELLYNQEFSLYNQLSQAMEPLRKIRTVSTAISEEVERLLDVLNTLKESAFTFQDLLETTESDPERLSFIEERLAVYHKFKLRYNARNGAELVQKYLEFEAKIEEFGSLETTINQKKQTLHKINGLLAEIGLKVETARLAAKKPLEEKIFSLLKEVGFEKSRFEIGIERNRAEDGELTVEGENLKVTASGFNKVWFILQTNPGMPAGPLSQIASGGEISRVMLALKAALADKSESPVLIFDEIDAGISGEIAHKVGDVMHRLARRFQILSITHLPQIAGKGDQHFRISKEIIGETTTSTVTRLTHEERINELAKMISGDKVSETALQNARELIRSDFK
ncbi:MAG: DNA repair protein RecN [Bacteroidia bacterium]|nr:DNA repair protein RecN [Bacteroidia bacterium]